MKAPLRRITKLVYNILNYVVYCFKQSNIHGCNHIAESHRHSTEVLLWLCLIGGSVYGALLLSSSTLLRYQENPTVISMERNRFAWNTSFPCATICPDAKISEVLLDEYITKSSARNKTKLKEFLMSLAQATYSTFDKVVPYDDISSDDYLSILLQLQFEFSPTVSNSAVNARQYFLQKAITENGICYSFNSQLAVYNSPE